ncbi:hypothetical protein, partial [Bacillus cereus]|uniref:hypothetical protein n=1 Tax=Bacillus cereus TaxID=1396 RepID=UPI002112CF20
LLSLRRRQRQMCIRVMDKFKRSFVIVEWHEVTYKNRKIALVIISCMMIMSSCANKFVEDRNRKHTFVQASKILVETVNRIYKK